MLKRNSDTLQTGETAPDFALPTVQRQIVRLSDFALPTVQRQIVRLSDYRGKTVVVVFIRGTW